MALPPAVAEAGRHNRFPNSPVQPVRHEFFARLVLGAVASPQYPGLYQIAVQFPPNATTAGSTLKMIIAIGNDTETFNINFSQ